MTRFQAFCLRLRHGHLTARGFERHIDTVNGLVDRAERQEVSVADHFRSFILNEQIRDYAVHWMPHRWQAICENGSVTLGRHRRAAALKQVPGRVIYVDDRNHFIFYTTRD